MLYETANAARAVYRSVPKSFNAIALSCVFLALPANAAAQLTPIADFGTDPGELNAYEHIPPGMHSGAPLVVALHGCTQRVSDFDDETGLVRLSNRYKFALLFPEQTPGNNAARCFNWFDDADNVRDAGEAASIKEMVDYMKAHHHVDPARIYIMGLSAGGGMTAAMLADYPDIFAGGGIIAGVPYGCETPSPFSWVSYWWRLWGGSKAGSAMYNCGVSTSQTGSIFTITKRDAEDWGDFVREASGWTVAKWPIVSIWQGTADRIVDPDNLPELIKQWTNVHGIDRNPDTTENIGDRIVHTTYQDSAGRPLVEAFEIDAFDHAIAVDPDASPRPCGRAGPYIEDANICTASRILTFWGIAQ